jgi:hypothetical protein
MEDGENEMMGSKRNQPQMTQINADELKKFVKLSGIPSSSSASSAVKPLRSVLASRRLLFIRG